MAILLEHAPGVGRPALQGLTVGERNRPGDSRLRWVVPDHNDDSAYTDFRREIAALAREMAGAGPGAKAEPGSEADPPQVVPQPGGTGEGPGGLFDIRDLAPYQVVLMARELVACLAPRRQRGESGVTLVTRDLILMEIGHRRTTTARHLRRSLRLPAATASMLAARLEGEGLIHSRRAASDGRVRILSLTKAGRSEAAEAATRWRHAHGRLCRRLPPAEVSALHRLARSARRQAGMP